MQSVLKSIVTPNMQRVSATFESLLLYRLRKLNSKLCKGISAHRRAELPKKGNQPSWL